MRNRSILVMLIVALVIAVMGSGCNILKEKVLDIVLKSETCTDEFHQNSASQVFEDVATIDIQQELDDAISDNGYDKSDLTDATVLGTSVSVTSFSHDHDWLITGEIQVEYLIVDSSDPLNPDTTVVSGPTTVVNYTEQSVQAALNVKVPVEMEPAGTAVLQMALDQFLADVVVAPQRAILRFRIVNGGVRPAPDLTDRIVFDWIACLSIQVVLPQNVEVPEPFSS